MIDRGIKPDQIVSIEYDKVFAERLQRKFEGVDIRLGDAYTLDRTLGDDDRHFAAIVSSLPLLTQPVEQRYELLRQAFARALLGAPFIQFSYSYASPLGKLADAEIYSAKKTGWILKNLPPARVWVYRQTDFA